MRESGKATGLERWITQICEEYENVWSVRGTEKIRKRFGQRSFRHGSFGEGTLWPSVKNLFPDEKKSVFPIECPQTRFKTRIIENYLWSSRNGRCAVHKAQFAWAVRSLVFSGFSSAETRDVLSYRNENARKWIEKLVQNFILYRKLFFFFQRRISLFRSKVTRIEEGGERRTLFISVSIKDVRNETEGFSFRALPPALLFTSIFF